MTRQRLNSLGTISIEKEESYKLCSHSNPVIDEFTSQKGKFSYFMAS